MIHSASLRAAGSEMDAPIWVARSVPPLRTASMVLRTSAMSASGVWGTGACAAGSVDGASDCAASSDRSGTIVAPGTASEECERACLADAVLLEADLLSDLPSNLLSLDFAPDLDECLAPFLPADLLAADFFASD